MVKESNKKKDVGLTHDKLKNKTKDKEFVDVNELISIRSMIERDCKEDVIKVVFHTSPSTSRTVESKKPSLSEMVLLMKMSVMAAKYEGKTDSVSLDKMIEVYNSLAGIATTLSLDRKLDEDFWRNIVTFPCLQNFVTSLILEVQKGEGVSEEDMKKFREERVRSG